MKFEELLENALIRNNAFLTYGKPADIIEQTVVPIVASNEALWGRFYPTLIDDLRKFRKAFEGDHRQEFERLYRMINARLKQMESSARGSDSDQVYQVTRKVNHLYMAFKGR